MLEDYKFWIGVVSAAGWVAMRHKAKSYYERFVVVAVSVGLGVSLSGDLAEYTGRSNTLAAIAIILSIWIALDIATSVLTDVDFKKAILSRISGGK